MKIIKFIRCLLRNKHRYSVPDLALFFEMRNLDFKGECMDCGHCCTQSGSQWSRLKSQQTTEHKE